jgi:hypothetical protein
MNKREFRQVAKRGKTKRWIVWQDEDQVGVQDGFVKGKMKVATVTTMEAVNVGKANEKSAEECAVDEMERRILMKTRQGYREVNPKTGQFLQEPPKETDTLESFKDLPQNLRFYKPQNSMNAYMQKMMDNKEAAWLRKRDGNMHIYVLDEKGRHRMYSSTTTPHQKDEPDVEIIERYPQIADAIQTLQVPDKTILLGELCCVAAGGHEDEYGFDVDNLDLVNGARGGLMSSSLELQEEHGYMGFCIWDIAFWDGKDLLNHEPALRRFDIARRLGNTDKLGFITYPEMAQWSEKTQCIYIWSRSGDLTINELEGRTVEQTLIDLAKDQKWEGWVVVDPEATFGEKSYNFRGKPERPKYTAKLKPKLEADFIVRYDPDNGIGFRGKGKKSVGVGSVFCYLWDHEAEEEVYVSKCGGGLDEENVLKFADTSLYPMVWKVEFGSWTKPSKKSPMGSLQFPEFLSVREDKKPEDCGLDQSPHFGGQCDTE